jgi:hypothetical protein
MSFVGAMAGLILYLWVGSYFIFHIGDPFVWWKFPAVMSLGITAVVGGAFVGHIFDKRSRKNG